MAKGKASARKPKVPREEEIEITVGDDQKEWLNQFLTDFGAIKPVRGQVEGSRMEFVRKTVLPQFFSEYHPASTQVEQDRMFESARVQCYDYLNNHTKRHTGGKAAKNDRIDVTNLWAGENAEVVEDLLAEYRTTHGLPEGAKITVEERRTIICDAYKALDEDIRAQWKIKAEKARKDQKNSKTLEGEERIAYGKAFPAILAKFVRDAYDKARVLVTANIAVEVSGLGAMEIGNITTDAAKDYKKTDAHIDALAYWGNWLRDSAGKSVKKDTPVIAAYPDRQNENYPIIPDFEADVGVEVLRKIVRVTVTAIWQREGGGASVPWNEIYRSSGDHRFVEVERQPEGYPLIDPGRMNSTYLLVWIEWLRRTQNKVGDEKTWFAFKIVYTASLKALPHGCEAIRRTEIKKGATKMWELEYEGWVEHCQVAGNILYPPASLEYEEFIIQQAAGAASRGKPHWLGLPAMSAFEDEEAFSEAERAFVVGVIAGVPEPEKRAISTLMDSVNTMYALLPAKNEQGLWSDDPKSLLKVIGLPTLLAATADELPEPLQFFSSAFWLPAAYFLPPFTTDHTSTFIFFEGWQHRTLAEGFLRHPESKTLLGGTHGTVWAIRSIIKVILNIGAAIGKLEPPTPPPLETDFSRVSENDWTRSISWIRMWDEAVQLSIDTLKTMFEERSRRHPGATVLSGLGSPQEPEGDTLLSTPTAPPDAGPSRLLRARPVPAASAALDVAADENLSDSRSFSDDEANHSDNFKPPEEGEDDDGEDDEDEGEAGEGEPVKSDGKSRRKGTKGKTIAQGERNPRPKDSSDGLVVLKAGMSSIRHEYEVAKGLICRRVSDSSIGEYILVAHPLGPMSATKGVVKWSGTIYELQNRCEQLIRETRGALNAFFNNPHPSYHPEDDAQALQLARESSMRALPLAAVVFKQQIVWSRAKASWPTIQYQYALFTELARNCFQLVPLVHESMRVAPEESREDLERLLKRFERAAYRARFVFQELHDLGAVSHSYFKRLERGWDDKNHVFEFSVLQSTVEIIHEWSDDAAAVAKWHSETRAKTWAARKEDLTKSPVPEAIWYRFGNPPAMKETPEVDDWLARGTDVEQVAEKPASLEEHSPSVSDQDQPGAHGGNTTGQDIIIDEVSPGEEDETALKILKVSCSKGGASSKLIVSLPMAKKLSSTGKRKGESESSEKSPKKAKKGGASSKKARQGKDSNQGGGSGNTVGAATNTNGGQGVVTSSTADDPNVTKRKSHRVRHATARSKGA